MTKFTHFKSVKRPPKPNTCLAAPDGFCLAAEPDFAPPVFELSADALFARLIDIVSSEGSWIRLEQEPSERKIKFVAVTGLMRFKDDVDIEIIPIADQQATLAIYSRSRIGYSDLGTNRKRVNDILHRVTTN